MNSAQGSGTLRITQSTAPKQVSNDIQTQCNIPEPIVLAEEIPPCFLASYPGSGSRLQWKLVRAITGIVTTDDSFSNGHHNVVGITTHFPHPTGREFPGAETVPKAVIFISHPLHTIPSYHDIIHASEKEITTFPPPRAPLYEWLDWRDLNFQRELEAWSKHFTYWMDRYSASNCLVVPYEKLLTRDHGPLLTTKMSEFLAENIPDASSPPQASELPCIWREVLENTMNSKYSQQETNNYTGTMPLDQKEMAFTPISEERRLSINSEPLDSLATDGDESSESSLDKWESYAKEEMRPYTESQKKEAVVVLTQLLERYSENDAVAPLLVEYIDEVVNRREGKGRNE